MVFVVNADAVRKYYQSKYFFDFLFEYEHNISAVSYRRKRLLYRVRVIRRFFKRLETISYFYTDRKSGRFFKSVFKSLSSSTIFELL